MGFLCFFGYGLAFPARLLFLVFGQRGILLKAVMLVCYVRVSFKTSRNVMKKFRNLAKPHSLRHLFLFGSFTILGCL